MRKVAFAAAVLSLCTIAAPYSLGAQETGRITGRVLDAQSGQGLGDVGVQIVGTTLGGMTDASGRYSIANIPAGTVTIQVRRIGYAPKTVTGIMLAAGAAIEQDVALEAATVQLQSLVVTAAAERGTVNEALEQQRSAPGIVNSVTAEQIARSPDSDAAAAVQRVSGVTVQDGKYVFVRGLGERYTTTSLNGVRIPSPDPERKVVPLDLFPSSLLKAVNTSKTFTPDQPGDFSGAQVDIQTRDFPSERTITYSSSVGYNGAATGQQVLAAPTAASEWLTFASDARALPAIIRDAGTFTDRAYSQAEMNQMVGSLRNVWSPRQERGIPNSAFGASIGGNDPLFGQQIGYVGSVTYSANQEVRRDEYKALTDPGTGNTAGNEFRGSTGRTSVLWGGLLNVSTFLGSGHLITSNNMMNRTSDSEAREDVGYDENYTRDTYLRRSSLTYVERSVRSNQLAGEHTLASGRHMLDWSATSSGVTRREPDRSDIVYSSVLDPATGHRLPFAILMDVEGGVRRTFADLDESAWNFDANYRLAWGSEMDNAVKVGGLFRSTKRDTDVLQYGIRPGARRLTIEEAAQAPEELFDGRYTSETDSLFTIVPSNQGGSYEARDLLGAGYLMVDYGLTSRVRVIAGARAEQSNVEVTTYDFAGNDTLSTGDYLDVLPALALNVRMTERQNLRFSLSQTLARPEYRELSPLRNEGVFLEQAFRGDPDLRRTLIRNADVRWEWYPNSGEVVSVAVFAKRFDGPIEQVEVPTSGKSTLTVVNSPGAENYGVELELRKDLGVLSSMLDPFTVFTNATLMRSEIRLDEASVTNPNRPMAGQAPYVVNAGVTWAGSNGYSATALYNVVGERIRTAGSNPYADTYEQPRHVVDVSLRMPITSQFGAKLDARNLLDAPYELTQGEVLRERYTAGRVFSVGLTWRR